jgi:drug/metabolite transporter (DMT)-like permease
MSMALEPFIGPAAGVGASVLWSFTTLFFTAAGKRLGSSIVNIARIALAIVWLGLIHRLLAGVWIPVASGHQVLLLALSGILGLSLGDWALFAAFISIGPRLAALIMTVSPIFAALFGWMALGETLSGIAWLGMALTLGGVAWVVLERPTQSAVQITTHRARGVLLAVIAAAFQAGGYLLSKKGIGHGWLPPEQHLSPQAATLIRMFFAGVFLAPMIVWLAARTRVPRAAEHLAADRRARRAGYFFTFCGSLVGPTLGVWLSLEACNRAKLGVAQTLISLTPVFILPLVIWIYKERVTRRAALGALIAVAGTALLFVPSGTG